MSASADESSLDSPSDSSPPDESPFTPPTDLNALSLVELFAELNPAADLDELFERLKREDLGGGSRADADAHGVDVTSLLTVDADAATGATLVARQGGVLAGAAALPGLLREYDERLTLELNQDDGTSFGPKDRLGTIAGPLRSLLAVERPLLNLLARLSGVATLTRKFVRQVDDLKAVICDTRKTTPGLRGLEKYAARCGGATLHRVGLGDAVLIKDNHLAGIADPSLAAWLTDRLEGARERTPLRFVEVEVDRLEQFEAILNVPAGLIDIVLLDNMDPPTLRRAVERRDERAPVLLLEASGGVTLDNVRAIGQSGVDRISVGAITHSAVSLNLALDVTTSS